MLIYGKNAIKEAILAKRPIFELWLDSNLKDQSFKYFLDDHNIKFNLTTKEELNKLAKDATHQGVVANVKDYEYYALEEILDTNTMQRFIMLDEINDPHNLGAILRTAEATKVAGIIISKKHQVQITPAVVKISSGGIEHVPLILVSNINQTIEKLKVNNVLVIGTDGNTTKSILEVPKNKSVCFVLGNEGTGLRTLVKRSCDYLVKIPMYGKTNSLNASVAAAVVMYLSLDM